MSVWRRCVMACFLCTSGIACSTTREPTPVSAQNQQLIRDVLHSVGVFHADEICIYPRAAGGAAVQITLPRRISISINEQWFDSLGDAGKRFVISHEAGHLKRWHGQKTMAAVLTGALVTAGAFWKGGIKVGLPTLVAWLALLSWYSRRMELEADGDAAQTPQIARAGIEVMRTCQRCASTKNSSIAQRFNSALYVFSHPPFERRIKALESIMRMSAKRVGNRARCA